MGIPAQQNPCDMWAIQEIINEIKPDFKTNNNFVSDRSREKFLLTFSPKGYLKRIK
jgi:cephalosporin hydroxylase